MASLIRIISVAMLTAVVLCSISSCGSTSESSSQSSGNSPGLANRVDVVYFHTPRRCVACIYVEERVKYIVDNRFSAEIASGKLVFNSYDLGVKANSSMIRKYGAVGSQLFINIVRDGKDDIRHIIEVWDPKLLDDQEAFDKYAEQLIRKSLDGV